MYGLTRSALTLIGAAAAGVLLWLAANTYNTSLSMGEHWATMGLVAAAGLTMALSQLLGGWTKWGWPRVSGNVFLIAFLPVLIAGGWILAAGEPGDHWLGSHARSWSDDLGIGGVVQDLTFMVPAIAFGIGLVYGFTFDTTGPRIRKQTPVATPVLTPETDGAREEVPGTDGVSDDRRVHLPQDGESSGPQPEPEPAPRAGEPPKPE
jgi:hypothetical protein